MSISLMQFLDRWIGIPICFILSCLQQTSSLLRYLVVSTRSNTSVNGAGYISPPLAPKRILFIELSEMGSAIIAHTAIRRAAALYPDAKISFLIFDQNRESVDLLGCIPHADVLTINSSNIFYFTWSTIRSLLEIRRRQFDTVIDLELFSRFTSILTALSGASTRVGFYAYTAEGCYRGNFLSHPVLYNPHHHMWRNFLALVLALGLDREEQPLVKVNLSAEQPILPSFTPTVEQTNTLQIKLNFLGVDLLKPNLKLILINSDPGTALPIRGWGEDRFAQLVELLLTERANSTIQIGIMGLKSYSTQADSILSMLPQAIRDRCRNLTGATANLSEVLTLYSQASLLVTNDSGPAHLASLTSLPTVVLFGPETPALYGPLGGNIHTVTANYACSPCVSAFNHRRIFCNNNRCMQAISPHEIAKLSLALLDSERGQELSHALR